MQRNKTRNADPPKKVCCNAGTQARQLPCTYLCSEKGKRKREREKERERERERDGVRTREKESESKRENERERERHMQRQRERAIKRPRTRSTAARQVSNAYERDLVTNQNV